MNLLRILTIGHSTHPLGEFVALLRRHGVTALADVRSSPFSRFNPQFNQPVVEREVEAHGIRYVFMGDELGGRPRNPSGYGEGGRALYGHLGEATSIDRLMRGAEKYEIALMCAEKDPKNCHRLRIAENLTDNGIEVGHILADGSLESHARTMERVRKQTGAEQDGLFQARDKLALSAQERRIAYINKGLA